MRNWSATSNLLSLLCHFLPSTHHFSHVLIEAYRLGTFTIWVMDGNFSRYWIAILVFISSFPSTDRFLAGAQMSFLSYRYMLDIPQSLPRLITVELIIVAHFGCLFFSWTEMYSNLHFSLAPSMFCIKLRTRVEKKTKALPRRSANINTQSSLWHKCQKQTLIYAFHFFVHEIRSTYFLHLSVSWYTLQIFSQRAGKPKEVPLQPVLLILIDSLSVRRDRWMLNCCLSLSSESHDSPTPTKSVPTECRKYITS